MKKVLSCFRTSLPHATSVLALLLFGAAPGPVTAADKIWDGEGANDFWLTSGNWDPIAGGTAPVANDALIFDGSVRLAPNNNFAAATTFQNITFGSIADAFTLSGNSVTLAAPDAAYTGGLNAPYLGGSISNQSFNIQTINLPLILVNGHHYIVGNVSGGSLNLAGALTLGSAASASFTLGVNTTGSGLANVNGILGGWATMLPPTTWAALDGSGNVVDYTAFTDVAAGGAIASAAASNVRITDSGANVTLAAVGTTDINSLHFGTGPIGNQIVDVAAGRVLRLGAKGGIFNASRQITGTSRILTIGTATGVGFVTAGAADDMPGDLYLIETPFIGNTGNQLVMNSRITNNGTGAVTVHLFGHISFPNVAHTYSGGTYINGGRLSATGPNTLGTGPVVVYPGGQLFLNLAGTYTNAMFIAGLGNAESVGNGAIRMGGRSISGPVTLMQDAATANGTISGIITGVGGLIVGAGSGNGVGTLTVGSAAGANDYAGDTLINGTNATAASTLQIAAGRNNVMPHGIGKGNVILRGISPTIAATFNLNGTDQIINGLSSIGTIGNTFVTSSTAGAITLTVGDGNANGNFGGVIQNGSGAVALSKIGTGTQTLIGPNTYTNGTTVTGGTLVFGAAGSFPTGGTPTVTINSNATLNLSAATPATLGAGSTLVMSNGTVVVDLLDSGAAITTPTLTANGSTNYVTITAIPPIISYPAQFVVIKYTALNGALNFGRAGSLPVSPGTPFAGFISNNVANGSVDFVVTAGPSTISWVGYSSGAPNSAWDTTTVNWANVLGAPTIFADGSFVRFNDAASNGIVTLSQTVSPASTTVSNNSLAYTFNGASAISGTGDLTKQGAGTLILNNGFNNFTGDVTISGGTLQVGNNDFNGNLPDTANIINNAGLTFSRADLITVPNLISGTGAVTQNGDGALILTAANTYTGAVSILKGTLQAGNNTALGTTNSGTTVTSGATLEIVANAINLGQEVITLSGGGVGGAGALVNNSGSLTFVGPNAARVIMVADATVGGNGRFDLRSATTANPLLGSLSTLGLPRKLTKVGTGTFGLIGITVDPALGDIEVREGIFSLEAAVTGVGNVLSNLTILPGGTLQMFAVTNEVNKVITMGGNGSTPSLSTTSGANTIVGPIILTNDCLFNVAGTSLNLNNNISGAGVMTKQGAAPLTLSGIATHAGTVINVGNLILTGRHTGGLTNAFGTTIIGSGTNVGPVHAFGALFPGNSNAPVTFTTGDLILEGTTMTFDLASTPTVGGGINDLIVVNGDLVVNGGTITINPLALLQIGVPYRLFNYTNDLIWNVDLTVNGPNNYTFTVNTNTPGQINIVASGGPPVWNGGSATVNNWSDAANWGGIAINGGDTLYFAGNNRLNNTNDTVADTSYTDIAFNTDAGAFVLNGNSITLGGNIINNSPNPATVKLGLSYNANRTFNGAGGPLIIGGGVTNTASLTTLTLSGSGILTNRLASADPNSLTNILSVTSNANWTLMDNSLATLIAIPVQLDVLAGTLNFGQGGSAPNLISTATAQNSRIGVTPGAPATLNMVNGTLTIGARLNTGAAANTIATINQSGGTLNVQALLQVSDSSANAYTTVNVTGGTLNVGDVAPQNFFLASRGTGVVTVASSGVINCATLDVSRNAAGNTLGSVGVVNLNGGILAATRVGAATGAAQAGGTPTATFNFNGGTLKARASSATFFQGNASAPTLPILSFVKAGGAIIDTTNFNISILESLQHDPGLGVTLDGGLVKHGTGMLTLTAANTYTGPTVINNGTLLVNGSIGATVVSVANGGTLAGTGTIGNNVTVSAGGTISAGVAGAPGNLTVAGNVSLQSGATNFMELNKTAVANDQIRAIAAAPTTITYAGTLALTNLAGTLAAGDSFKLFTATNYAGSFSAITPASPGPGLQWNTSALNTSGTILVAIQPIPKITNFGVIGGNVVFSGTNGPANASYVVLTATDVTLPLASWTPIATNTFNGSGNFSFTNGAPADPQRFYLLQVP
jgi:fibronectin-binding autotransporter adhesin